MEKRTFELNDLEISQIVTALDQKVQSLEEDIEALENGPSQRAKDFVPITRERQEILKTLIHKFTM